MTSFSSATVLSLMRERRLQGDETRGHIRKLIAHKGSIAPRIPSAGARIQASIARKDKSFRSGSARPERVSPPQSAANAFSVCSATEVAEERLSTPSFTKMRSRCLCTVRGEMQRISAMS